MEKAIRKFASFDEMKDEEYRYWQSVTPAGRLAAGHQVSVEGYRALGYSCDGADLKRVAVRTENKPDRREPINYDSASEIEDA